MRNPLSFDPVILNVLKSLPPPISGAEITYSVSGETNYHQFVDNHRFHINVMSVDWNKMMEISPETAEAACDACIGAGYHEWGHFFTEMKEDAKLRVYPQIAHQLHNIYEDIRIEEIVKRKLGEWSEKQMQAAITYIFSDSLDNAKKQYQQVMVNRYYDKNDLMTYLMNYLLMHLRAIGRKQDYLLPSRDLYRAILEDKFNPAFIKKIDEICEEVLAVAHTESSHTRDTIRLTAKTMDLVKLAQRKGLLLNKKVVEEDMKIKEEKLSILNLCSNRVVDEFTYWADLQTDKEMVKSINPKDQINHLFQLLNDLPFDQQTPLYTLLKDTLATIEKDNTPVEDFLMSKTIQSMINDLTPEEEQKQDDKKNSPSQEKNDEMNNSEDSSEQNESNESDEEGEPDDSNLNEEEKNGKPSGESKSGKPSKSKQKIEDMEEQEQEQSEDAVGSEQKQEKNDEIDNSEDNMEEQKQPGDPEDVVGSEQKQEKQKQDNEGEATTDSDEAQTEDESESKATQKPSNKEQESKPKRSENTPPSSDPVKRKKEPFEKTAFNAPDIKQAENKDIFNDDMTEAKVDGSFDMGDMFQDKVKAAGALTRNDVLPPMGFRPQGKGEYTLNPQSLSTVRIIRDKAKKLMEETLLEEELLVSRGSRIAKDKLYKVMLNSNDIFLKRFETSQTSADVYVMMDISGSMQGVINQAKEAFATTLVAFEDIEGVRIGGGVFPHYNNVFTPLFDIGEKKKIKNSLNRLNEIDANGAEDIAEAVKCGIAKVLEKTSIDRKKILIVITDGGQSEDPQALLQLERAKKLGFKVIGIGIGKAANNVKNVFEYADVIHNMKDMPGIVSKLFESVMKDYLQHKKPAVKESIKNAA